MPLHLELKTATDIDNLINGLIAENIFNTDALAQAFVVDTEGRTYPVSKISNLSMKGRAKYKNIKFFARLKENPQNAADFGEFTLEEFINSADKKGFVYNKAYSEVLINIQNHKTTINGEKQAFQNSLIDPQKIVPLDFISKTCLVFPVITVYSNTYEAQSLFKSLQTNITYNSEIIDPYAATLPFDKIVPNQALIDLINISHKNFIKNYEKLCIEKTKNIKQNKQKAAVTNKYRKFLKKYIQRFQKSLEKNTIKAALFDEETITAQQHLLTRVKNDFESLEELIRNYSQANLDDYPQLSKDLSEQLKRVDSAMEKNSVTFERVLVGGVVLGFLMILAPVSLNQLGILTSRAVYSALTILSFLVIIGAVAKSTQYINVDQFKLEIARINRLNAEINKILECQTAIELISSYQERCKFISKFSQILTPEDLKNEILVSLRSSPSSVLSSSDYLLKNADNLHKKTSAKKTEETPNFKEDKQEESDEENKELTGTELIPIPPPEAEDILTPHP